METLELHPGPRTPGHNADTPGPLITFGDWSLSEGLPEGGRNSLGKLVAHEGSWTPRISWASLLGRPLIDHLQPRHILDGFSKDNCSLAGLGQCVN